MTTSGGDYDLAAALLLGAESGLLSVAEIRRIVDREIETRLEAEAWLLEASLAVTPTDVLHALRERAAGHSMLSDPFASLDAADIALKREGTGVEKVVSPIMKLYPYEAIPPDLKELVWQLDQEVVCDGGVPDSECINVALRKLLAAAHGRSPWRFALEAALGRARFE